MPDRYRVVALPGEGVGLEVVPAALEILLAAARLKGIDIVIDWGLIGELAFNQLGDFFPEATAKLCEGADGILLGAVSRGGLLELRSHFDFFVNLRPVTPSASLLDKSSIKAEKLQGVDILFVRELVSGIYFGASGRVEEGDSYGYHTMLYRDREIRRVARVALAKAQSRRGLVTVAHKENALPHLPWSRLVQQEAEAFPQVTVEPMLVDNLAMQLVINPQRFDVILAGNLFGDILSDIGGAIAGSIGLLGSASLNSQGFGLYEPIHGTAPDIAGKGIANPLGTLAAAILMVQQWGEEDLAKILIQAQANILAMGYRTADLNPQGSEILVTTEELVALFAKEIARTTV